MSETVRADELLVGDVVVLPHEHGPTTLRILEVIPRVATIKFTGRRLDSDGRGGDYSWG